MRPNYVTIPLYIKVLSYFITKKKYSYRNLIFFHTDNQMLKQTNRIGRMHLVQKKNVVYAHEKVQLIYILLFISTHIMILSMKKAMFCFKLYSHNFLSAISQHSYLTLFSLRTTEKEKKDGRNKSDCKISTVAVYVRPFLRCC